VIDDDEGEEEEEEVRPVVVIDDDEEQEEEGVPPVRCTRRLQLWSRGSAMPHDMDTSKY
jgi:hypothetical protein